MDFLETRPQPVPTQLPYRLRAVGRVREDPRHSTRGTHHGDAMLTVVMSGRGAYHQRSGVLPVSAGMVGLVLPGDDPGILMTDARDPYDHYYCRFAGRLALETAGAIASGRAERFTFWPEAAGRVTPWLARMPEAFRRVPVTASDQPGTLTPAEALLAQVLAELSFPQGTPR